MSYSPGGNESSQRSPGDRPPGDLLDVVYDELRALASAYLSKERSDHTLQTTALVHEAWLRLSQRQDRRFDDRAHFFRAAALAMRRILLHHAEKRAAQKRGGGQRGMSMDEKIEAPGGPDTNWVEILALNDALKRLAEVDAQKAQVVELRYFGGCSIEETAEALGIGTATVERDWRFARAWLRNALGGSGDTQTPAN
ncbi:MAG TPA: sigma-70 family RNA polymerase sigma factor [Phycisphaerae bacterium]|nr:sigma-70 family RNA polymerase sigma factor [Phycisphaerae bacterium]